MTEFKIQMEMQFGHNQINLIHLFLNDNIIYYYDRFSFFHNIKYVDSFQTC